MQMICILLGVPESERHWLFEAIEPQFDFGGSRKASVGQMTAEEAGTRMYTYGQELIAAEAGRADRRHAVGRRERDAGRRRAPAVLSDIELYLFFSLLFSAGAETTRNAVAGGLLALAEHPDQLAVLRADLSLLPTAVEEMVRWTSPSPSKRRTATRDVELGGCAIEAGQKVQIWEGSANRDPRRSTIPTPSTSRGSPTRTWVSARASTTASAPTWPGWSCGCCSRSCSARFSSVRVVKPVEWTRSNRHTGIRHLVVELDA